MSQANGASGVAFDRLDVLLERGNHTSKRVVDELVLVCQQPPDHLGSVGK